MAKLQREHMERLASLERHRREDGVTEMSVNHSLSGCDILVCCPLCGAVEVLAEGILEQDEIDDLDSAPVEWGEHWCPFCRGTYALDYDSDGCDYEDMEGPVVLGIPNRGIAEARVNA